jgi:hypothetical protein
VNKATTSYNSANNAYNQAIIDKNNAQDRFRIAESALKAAQ